MGQTAVQINTKLLNINEIDHFSLLAKNGADTAGAVTVSFDEKLSDLLEPYFRNI